MDGNYDGTVKVEEVHKYGDCGLGTFDRIDGEMVVLNDTVFQCLYDGSVTIADEHLTVPFADVAKMGPSVSRGIRASRSLDRLTKRLNKLIDPQGMYLVTLEGRFGSMTVRSEMPQTKPYKPLAETLQHAERRFDYADVSGILIGLYTPETMAESTGSGWHFHFISADRRLGGHVLSLSCGRLRLKMTRLTELRMFRQSVP
ncbi:MAG: acetolactate decarboxylase [Bacteroidaceae bacterium]|nr:acetolactate decarboxylase [Bacteroidaceae bacterium]